MDGFKEYKEAHQEGTISIKNVPESLYLHFIRGEYQNIYIKGDLGIQIAKDGRVWICIDEVAFIMFSPHPDGEMQKSLKKRHIWDKGEKR